MPGDAPSVLQAKEENHATVLFGMTSEYHLRKCILCLPLQPTQKTCKRDCKKFCSDDDEEEFLEEFYESPSDDASETCHESDSKGKKRKKRLSSFELSETIVTKEIKTRTQLLAYTNNQKCEGKKMTLQSLSSTEGPA